MSQSRPNILYILSDQHRWDCLGVAGNRDVRTPHLDALAEAGRYFSHCFCPYPICAPSRYSMFSGRDVHEHGCRTNRCTLPPDVASFPALLRDAGYHTQAIGKMHLTPTYLDIGFDAMQLCEQEGPGRWDDDYHRMLRERGLVDANDLENQAGGFRALRHPEYDDRLGALPSNLPSEFHSTEWVGREACRALQQWDDTPQLLLASFVKPHLPFDPPEEWVAQYEAEALELLPGWTDACPPHNLSLSRGHFAHENVTEDRLRRVMAYYYATISHVDAQVGILTEVLKESGRYDKTIIVYTSDHGEYLGFQHMLGKVNYMYDPIMRVPLIVKFPHQERATCDGLTSLLDLAPTLLRQCGIHPPEEMRGLNLASPNADRECVFAEHHEGAQTMARTATRKLIAHESAGTGFLYDLERDPLETTNRIDDPAYQADRVTLEAALNEWRPPGSARATHLDESAPTIQQPNVPPRDESRREELKTYYLETMRAQQQARAAQPLPD